MKKIISILLVALMVTALLPLYSSNVNASTPATVTLAEAVERLNWLISLFDGRYFTVNQQPCNYRVYGHPNENESYYCSNCLASIVTKDKGWCSNLTGMCPSNYNNVPGQYYPNNWGYPDGNSCHGFANYIHWCIFAKNNEDYLSATHVATGAFNSDTLNYARPGDVLRIEGSKISHSAVYVSHNDYSVYVIDSNWDPSRGNCKVETHSIKYSTYPYATVAITGVANYDRNPTAPIIRCAWTGIEGEPTTISWDPVFYATRYQYFVSEYPEGYAYQYSARAGFAQYNSITFNDLPSGEYFAFVHSVAADGSVSPKSNWTSFEVRKDDYVAPKVIISDGHLYALYEANESWTYAKKLCESMGGHLATVTSGKEEKVIEELLEYAVGDGYWLGANNIKSSEFYEDISAPFSWITNESFNYSNWYSGQPSRTGIAAATEHFLEIRRDLGNAWNDVRNRTATNDGFILEIDDVSAYQPTATAEFGTSEYRLFDKTMTWNEAEAFCENLGGHLATIESVEEQYAVGDLLKQGRRGWYYLGGTRNAGNSVMWLDGTSFSDGLIWSDYNYGDYTFMYKENSAVGFMKNLYHPRADQVKIGFVCEFDDAVIAPCEHSLMSYIGPKNSTCVEKGWDAYYYCLKCGQLFDMSLNEISSVPFRSLAKHTSGTSVRENEKGATCTTKGSYDSVVYCTVCETEISRTKVNVNALGHDFEEEFTVDVEPTQTTPGSKSRHCTRCNEVTDVTEIPSVKPQFEIGDVDSDGSITMKDVLLLRKVIAGSETLSAEQMKFADLDGSGDVNMKDVLKLRKIIAGAE